jgi:hypothetical protein
MYAKFGRIHENHPGIFLAVFRILETASIGNIRGPACCHFKAYAAVTGVTMTPCLIYTVALMIVAFSSTFKAQVAFRPNTPTPPMSRPFRMLVLIFILNFVLMALRVEAVSVVRSHRTDVLIFSQINLSPEFVKTPSYI